jgi:hypothetical protein
MSRTFRAALALTLFLALTSPLSAAPSLRDSLGAGHNPVQEIISYIKHVLWPIALDEPQPPKPLPDPAEGILRPVPRPLPWPLPSPKP